jgi:CTP synthase
VLTAVHEPKHEVTIALVGKYIDLPDAYLSVTEALRAGGFAHQTKVNIRWVASDACETSEGAASNLSDVDGICVPGGFGVRGIEGKLGALRFARENKIPTLGLCLGLQCMVIEYSRNVVGLEGASSTEFNPEAKHPVIATMAEQVDILASGEMGGTMRLGSYPAKLEKGSIVAEVYESEQAVERHRHRYEVNNAYRDQLAQAGLVFSGTSPDSSLVEYVELPRQVHPYYVSTQAHPEFKSRPTRAHPLFIGLIKASLVRQEASRLFEVKDA